jgi:hypothetical protein
MLPANGDPGTDAWGERFRALGAKFAVRVEGDERRHYGIAGGVRAVKRPRETRLRAQ